MSNLNTPVAALALIACLSGSQSVAVGLQCQAQRSDERSTFRADVELTTLNVVVVDDKALPISGLTAADFRVIEDGVPRDVAFLLDPEDTPLDLGVLVDLSLSMEEAPWRGRTAAFLASLHPGDCAFLLGFNETIGELAWGRPDDHGLLDYLERASNDGGTKLYDAMLAGLRELAETTSPTLIGTPLVQASSRLTLGTECPVGLGSRHGENGRRRRALVVVTDGWDTLSEYGASDVLLWGLKWKIPIFQIYSVAFPGGPESISPPSELRDRRIRVRVVRDRSLDKLTRPTGGRVVDQDAGYEKLLSLLRASYVIGYQAPRNQARPLAELTVHNIDIEVRRKGAKASYSPLLYRSTVSVEIGRAEVARGLDLVRQGRPEEAIDAFDAAILADASAADGHYQRAKVLALLGRPEQALQDAVRAIELDPGVPILHELVARLAADSGEAELAFEHLITAAQGGIDMQAYFEALAPLVADAAELQERLRVPRIVVRAVPSDSPNPLIDAALRGKALVALRHALVASPHLAVVIDARQATHALLVEAGELSERPRRRLEIRLELVDATGQRVYRNNATLRDIDDADATSADLASFIATVEARLMPSGSKFH